MSVRGFGGMSHTDRKQREQEDFLSVVQRARKDFIDVSAHSHTNAQPLSKAAVDRHKKYQSYLATTPVANLGFFATDFPRSVFSSEKGLLDPNGEAAALAIEALTHPALDADMGEQVIRRAQIVASVVTEILPLVPPESLVITCDQFAEDLESTEA